MHMQTKKEFVIFLTTRCQLRCRHCSLDKENPHDLPLENLEKIRDLYHPYKTNFMGGEGLLYPHIEDAFEIFSDVPITISSNGLLVPDRIGLLQKARAVLLSLEGNKKSTDAIRGKGVFKRVVGAAELLRKSGVEVTLRCSVWGGNLRDVPNLIKLAERLDTGLMFFPMLGTAPLDPAQQAWLFKQMEGCENCWVDQPHFFCYAFGKESKCPAGWHRLAVDCGSNISPCQWLRYFHLGKVGDPFDLIKRNAETFVKTFKTCPAKCFGCKFMESCSGSCRVSMSYTNCPLLPQWRRFRPELLERAPMGKKLETLRTYLSGVVSC